MNQAGETRQHRSFRFSNRTLSRLEARAHEIRETRTGLAERYVEEGLRMDEHPGIGFADGPGGRRAVVVGTGLDVWEVITTVKLGGSAEVVARYLELAPASVRAAVHYYASFPDEIDERLAHQEATAQREEAASQRERAILP